MNVHISYKMAKAPDVEREFTHHISKLQKRVQVYKPELVHLHAIVDQGSSKGAMMVSLNLRLPSGQLAAQEAAPTAVAAAKRAFAELMKQLTKHKDILRTARDRRRAKGNGIAKVAFEDTIAAVHPPVASEEDISNYINANAQKLLAFIRREIWYRVNTGLLETNQLTPEEVLDEAVASALDENHEKPEMISIGRWMYRLATRAIDGVACQQEDGGASALHLEDSMRKPNVRASDEPVLQYHQPDESFTGETVIRDSRLSTPEEIVASEEFLGLMEQSLLSAPKEDREAFVLYAIEGFTLEEIGALADRTPEAVRESVRAAREHLKKTMAVPEPEKEKLLRATRIA